MSTARSAFTEAIEEHLALKKTNATLEPAMPLARYDVGDPLDRYPGGPNRAADGSTVVIAEDLDADAPVDAASSLDAQMIVGPSPEQAMEAATALEPAFADRPFEPLAPMLSLVEDIDAEESTAFTAPSTFTPEPTSADVLRFPGGVGPREESATELPMVEQPLPMETHAFTAPATGVSTPAGTAVVTPEALTGEQPVIVIDADEPLATSGFDEPVEPSRPARRSKPRFFGLGRKKSKGNAEGGDGWFTDGPRDFNWD